MLNFHAGRTSPRVPLFSAFSFAFGQNLKLADTRRNLQRHCTPVTIGIVRTLRSESRRLAYKVLNWSEIECPVQKIRTERSSPIGRSLVQNRSIKTLWGRVKR